MIPYKRVTSSLGEISTAIDSEANDSQDGIERLAEQTANATSGIAQIIKEIQDEVSDTKSNIDVVEETNAECVDSMKEAHQAFKKINSSVENMSNSIRTLTSVDYQKEAPL